VVQSQKNPPVTVGQSPDLGVIMSSPDLRSKVVGVVDPKDAPNPRRENPEMSW